MAHILANAEGVFPFLREHGVFFNGDADVAVVANAASVPMSVRLRQRQVYTRIYFSSIGKFGGYHHIHVAPFVVKGVTHIDAQIKMGSGVVYIHGEFFHIVVVPFIASNALIVFEKTVAVA